LVVLAANAQGVPVSGVGVTWTTTSGLVTSQSTTTGADGTATAAWTLGALEGPQDAVATADNGARATAHSSAVSFSRPIAFGGSGNSSQMLRMMNADGTEKVQISTLPAWGPAWSPDGKRLAFMSGSPNTCTGDFGDLVVIDFTTVRQTQLTRNDRCARVGEPEWSPDGTQLAFVDHANMQIVLMSPDGSGIRTISIANGVDSRRPSRVTSGRLLWFRDGSGFLFGGKGASQPVAALWKINVDGSGLQQIQNHPISTYPAAFSPDGSSLALEQQLVPHTYELRIMVGDPGDVNAAKEVSGSAGIGSFAWSPNGKLWLADVFGLGQECAPGMNAMVLYDYDAATRRATARTRLAECGADAAWRP
jgi:dipeptidyl aminopeptidase/acylaminoacyl peptidase